MANQQIGFQTCKSDMQAQVMANAMEQAGCDVFSVFEVDGRWHVWFKFTDADAPGRINEHFSRGWKEFQDWDKERQRQLHEEDEQ
jgi:hypothetical protein